MSREREEPYSIEVVQEKLAKRKEQCSPECGGWDVFNTAGSFTRPELEIEVCDECCRQLNPELDLWDDDVAQLPEAQEALRKEIEETGADMIPDEDYGQLPILLRKAAGSSTAEEDLPTGFRLLTGLVAIPGSKDQARSPFTTYGVRGLLETERDPCSSSCKGWRIIENDGSFWIAVCVDCTYPEHVEVTDCDIEQLPEAWDALVKARKKKG